MVDESKLEIPQSEETSGWETPENLFESPDVSGNSPAILRDVAQAAHYSLATTARALNKFGGTHPATMLQVRQAARKLGYVSRLDEETWNQPGQDTKRIGVIGDLSTREPQFFAAMQRLAAKNDFRLLLLPPAKTSETELRYVWEEYKSVDAWWVDEGSLSRNVLAQLQPRCPLVVTNRVVPEAMSIVPDIRAGMQKLLAYLHSLGHREVTYLSGHPSSWYAKQCERNFWELAETMSLQVQVVPTVADTLGGGAQAFTSFKQNLSSAVIAFGTWAACGFVHAAQQLHLLIGTEISVAAIGDQALGSIAAPSLTVLSPDWEDLATAGVRYLRGVLKEEGKTKRGLQTRPMKLRIRSSTGSF